MTTKTDMDPGSAEGLALLPPIRRARGWRLYAENGKRFLDLWQDDSRGILGAKGTGVGTVAKAAVDKGLCSPLPSVHGQRLKAAIRKAWPGWEGIRFFADSSQAAKALGLETAGGESGADFLHDPARELCDPDRGRALNAAGSILLLRPFSEHLGGDESGFRAAWLRLPCPRVLAPIVILFRETAEAAPPVEPVPPILLASAVKALAEYCGYRAAVGEESWKRADRRILRLFERRGPWLFPRCPREAYGRLFRAALDKGILLSPDPGLPSMLPGEFDDGELKILADLEF